MTDFVDCYLQTCGPVYRVVVGRTETGRVLYVWVSDAIVAHAYSDDGISADEAMRQTKTDYPKVQIDGVRLVYVPDAVKRSAVEEIGTSSGNAFWQVTCSSGDDASKAEHFVPHLVQP